MNSYQDIISEIHQETLENAPQTIPRTIIDSPAIHLEKDLALVIQGVRRCGKSTLMRQIAETRKIKQQSVFINFEDPRLSHMLNSRFLDALVTFQKNNLGVDNGYLFLDEIQNVPEWEKWAHIQLEKKNTHLIISGSNSTLLSGKLGTALTGRHLTVELFPFSFEEAQLIHSPLTLENHLRAGGFPRVLTFPEPQRLLREYFSDIIERDVRQQVAARSTQPLMQIAKAIYESTGSETSQRKLAKQFDMSPDTVGQYINAFISSYLIMPCPYFTYSERKSVVRAKKYYPIDLGLHEAIATKGGLDIGKKFETFIFHLLRSRFQQVYYWRDQGEVDFVVETKMGALPIQVSWDGKKERHEAALNEFQKAHPHALTGIHVNQHQYASVLPVE